MTLDVLEPATPVSSWSPSLAGMWTSRPAIDDQTVFSADSAHALGARDEIDDWSGGLIVTSEDPGTEQHWLIMRGLDNAVAVKVADRVVRYQVSEPITEHAPMRRRTKSELLDLLESVKEGLRLPITNVSRLVGVPRTTLYRSKKVAYEDLDQRLLAAVTKAEFLSNLFAENATAAESLVHDRAEDVTSRLDANDFIGTRLLFTEVKRQLAAARRRPSDVFLGGTTRITDETRRLLDEPGLAEAVGLIVSVSPYGGELEIDRARAAADFTTALDAVREGDLVAEEWGFLLTLRRDERVDVSRRASDLIRS